MTGRPLLECLGVSKAFGAVQALYRVDFDVAAGEVVALVGDNGAGKSTLTKGIAGIYPFDEGEVRFEGQPVRIHGPREASRLGIEVVYQDLALADNLDVVANLFLGRERTTTGSSSTSRAWSARPGRRSTACRSRRCAPCASPSPACRVDSVRRWRWPRR